MMSRPFVLTIAQLAGTVSMTSPVDDSKISIAMMDLERRFRRVGAGLVGMPVKHGSDDTRDQWVKMIDEVLKVYAIDYGIGNSYTVTTMRPPEHQPRPLMGVNPLDEWRPDRSNAVFDEGELAAALTHHEMDRLFFGGLLARPARKQVVNTGRMNGKRSSLGAFLRDNPWRPLKADTIIIDEFPEANEFIEAVENIERRIFEQMFVPLSIMVEPGHVD